MATKTCGDCAHCQDTEYRHLGKCDVPVPINAWPGVNAERTRPSNEVWKSDTQADWCTCFSPKGETP